MEPCNFFHGGCDSLGEGGHLYLKINRKGLLTPPTNDLDGAVRDGGFVKNHHTTRANRVVANLMVVEAKAFKSELEGVKAQELDNLRACDTSCGGRRVGVLSTDRGVGVGAVSPEME